MAMLSLGTFALIAVVGAALFGGFDPRKKKKNGGRTTPVEPEPTAPDDLIDCAAILDISADGFSVSVDGAAEISTQAFFENVATDVVRLGDPVVMFSICEPDPLVLDVIEQLCAQRPDIVFLATYLYRIPQGQARQAATQQCQGLVAKAAVFTSPEEGTLVSYVAEQGVAELQLPDGGDIAQWIANIVAFADGAPHDAMVLEELA